MAAAGAGLICAHARRGMREVFGTEGLPWSAVDARDLMHSVRWLEDVIVPCNMNKVRLP